MNNDVIIRNIKNHLTGEKESDVAYLQTEMDIYRNLKNDEVIYAIATMLFDYLDPAIKEKLDLRTHALLDERRNEYETVVGLLNEEKYDEAKNILLKLIDIFEKATYKADNNYYDFDQMAEYFIFCESVKNGRSLKIKRYPEPVTYYFYQLSSIYLKEGNVLEAIDALLKALKYNPRCQYVIQQLCVIYNEQNMYEEHYEMAHRCLKYAYTKEQLAFGFKELGRYFKKYGILDIAVACYINSKYYVKNLELEQEIKDMMAEADTIFFTEAIEIVECLKKNKIPEGPSNLVIEAMDDFLAYSKEIKDYPTASYIACIMLELTDELKYEKELEEIEELKGYY